MDQTLLSSIDMKTNYAKLLHKYREYATYSRYCFKSTHHKIFLRYGSNSLVINNVQACNITKSWIMQKKNLYENKLCLSVAQIQKNLQHNL